MAIQQKRKDLPVLVVREGGRGGRQFYASMFPDSRVDRVTALPSESPSGPPGSVKVVDFTLLGQRFQAMSAGPHHEFNDAISIVVLLRRPGGAGPLLERAPRGRRQAPGVRLAHRSLRRALADRARRMDEMMRDRDPARSKRVTDAMLKMVKLDIAALEKAYRG